jgi:cytochrome c-type biogenesis protein CcmH/NrfF
VHAILSVLLLVCTSVGGLPDSACTPGVVDPRVTQENLATTVCTPNYTKKVRPSSSLTNRLKRRQLTAYGHIGPSKSYEEDHLISLVLGGAPSDPLNLWPEPLAGPTNAKQKDQLESELHRLVCSNQLSLVEAQATIRGNWVAAYELYLGPLDK